MAKVLESDVGVGWAGAVFSDRFLAPEPLTEGVSFFFATGFGAPEPGAAGVRECAILNSFSNFESLLFFFPIYFHFKRPDSHFIFGYARIPGGELAEWSIAAVLKTVEPKGSGGSNPSL